MTRESFDCGETEPNEFLPRYARQSHEKGSAKSFIATPVDDGKHILGFYSLTPASIDYACTPALVKNGLERYDVPVFRLGHVAVDRTVQGLDQPMPRSLPAGAEWIQAYRRWCGE